MKTENVKLTLWLPKSLVVSGKLYQLNFSQLLSKTLIDFFNKQNIDPNQLLEDIFNEKQDKRDERREFYRKRAKEFWQEVAYRRALRRNEKYLRIKKIIEEKQKSPFSWYSDEEKEFMEEEADEGFIDIDEADQEDLEADEEVFYEE